MTATACPRCPSSRDDSAASASSPTRSASCSGSRSTRAAPMRTAAAHVVVAGSAAVSTVT
ncbi:hypothetical protein I549_0471 [Mycobacterium avium subsp. avium 2285 (R)]|nr:hypothetical protein I549_0471 [Mycobacterium avium subsp. avium 2285 (R)]